MKLLPWYIPLGLLALLLCLLLRRRVYKAYPWFLAYVAYGVAAELARIFAYSHPRTYFATFWLTDAGYALLGATAMYEILRKVLRGFAHIWWTHLIFPAIVAIGVGLSVGRMYAAPPHLQGRLLLCIVTGEIAVRIVQMFIFAGLVTFIGFFGFRWRQYPLGIASGFGVYSTVALLITMKFSDSGTRFTFLLSVISVVAYSFAVLIWIGFFFVPEIEEPPPNPEMLAAALDTLNQYLDWLRRMR
ncbi:MAG: hypothetical protein WCA49_23120 [Candidatus Sulfotelmatobacter sp.]